MSHDVQRCDCGALFVYLKTKAGRHMPVNWDGTVIPLDTHYVHGRHTSHFATCPNALKHRKPRRP
ncbi:MAG TPA: hypothetical protein VE907_06360 [Gammaproteobacteria bacterium]|nr:hypothetical protein [Gammaproteobacteria bacterium]